MVSSNFNSAQRIESTVRNADEQKALEWLKEVDSPKKP